MQLGYVAGYERPAIILEDRAIGAVLDEEAGDALMNFISLAASLDPSNLTRAEP